MPSRVAELFYPGSLRPVRGDVGSVSVVEENRAGTVLVYLNATPKQDDERRASWPAYRIAHQRDEATDVHEVASAVSLPFRGGTGACVIDDYVTRVKANHYREIACFVQGRTAASVVVATALRSEWPRVSGELERVVSAYEVH